MERGKEQNLDYEALSGPERLNSQVIPKEDILDVKKTLTEFSNLIINTKVIFEPYRFTIMLLLYKYKILLFSDLQILLEITPGNLDHHVRKLQKAGYVKKRRVLSWRPLNAAEITSEGMEIFSNYLLIFKRKFMDIMNWVGDIESNP